MKVLKLIVVNTLVLLALLAAVEGLLYWTVGHPNVLHHLPWRLRTFVHNLYMGRDVRVVQYVPGCSRYDPEIGYTLDPGDCRFSNLEFAHDIHVNSLGVRDDEQSLKGPEILVLGDSQAMGWGVGGEETFSRILEEITGKKVLDTGVSSYGTVRELMMARRVDLSKTGIILIQYSKNDLYENEEFLQNGNRHKTMSREIFEAYCERNAKPRQRFFGQYLSLALARFLYRKRIREDSDSWPSDDQIALLFANALVQNRDLLQGRTVVVFEVNETGEHTGFAKALEDLKRNPEVPEVIRKLMVIDTGKILDRDRDFYPLDGHLNAAGHKTLARALSQVIGESARGQAGNPFRPE